MNFRGHQTRINRCLCLLFFFLLFFVSKAQETACDFLKEFAKTNSEVKTKKYILNTLNNKPDQSDCFYKTSINTLKSTTGQDTIENICLVWANVSSDKCIPKQSYLEYLTEKKLFGNQHCPELKNFVQKCKQEKMSHEYLFKIINCTNYSCNEIDSVFETQTDSFSINETKAIVNLLAQRQCTTSKTYLKFNEIIVRKEPTFNSLYNQAKLYFELNKLPNSYTYFAKAEKMARIPEQKSACYLGLARLLEKQKEYSKAKEFAQLATENDPLNQESFVFLAQLFTKAETICQSFSEHEKCGLYLLIAKMYGNAGSKADREKYLAKSGIEKIQLEGKVKTIQLSCFINEEIELKK